MRCPECNKEMKKCLGGKVKSYLCLNCTEEYYDTSWGLLNMKQWNALKGNKYE